MAYGAGRATGRYATDGRAGRRRRARRRDGACGARARARLRRRGGGADLVSGRRHKTECGAERQAFPPIALASAPSRRPLERGPLLHARPAVNRLVARHFASGRLAALARADDAVSRRRECSLTSREARGESAHAVASACRQSLLGRCRRVARLAQGPAGGRAPLAGRARARSQRARRRIARDARWPSLRAARSATRGPPQPRADRGARIPSR